MKRVSRFEKACDLVNRNPFFQLALVITTACALFGDDIRILITSPAESRQAADESFLVLSAFAFVLFGVEVILQCVSVEGYFPWPPEEGVSRWGQLMKGDLPKGSFYFWLDLIATFSLVFDLTRFLDEWGGTDPLVTGPTVLDLGEVENQYATSRDSGDDGMSAEAAQSARASQASLSGARAGRVVKLVRMVRLIRIVKLCKSAQVYQDGQDTPLIKGPMREDPRRSTFNFKIKVAPLVVIKKEPPPSDALFSNSQVGKSMSELTQRRVIVGVLAILITLPLVEYPTTDDAGLYSTRLAHSFLYKSSLCNATNTSADMGCLSFNRGLRMADGLLINFQSPSSNLLAMKHVVDYSTTAGTPGEFTSADFIVYDPKNGLGDIGSTYNVRKSSQRTIVVKSEHTASGLCFLTLTHWDLSEGVSDEALMSLLLTTFIIVLLGAGTFIFAADTQRLVIEPVETMMKRVQEIRNDPLSTKSKVKIDASQKGMETDFLLQTIDKIGTLMRIGFGEAGAEIIAENLKDSTGDQLDTKKILKGRGIVSIFGFCDIRNFTDTTECLQEEVMTFVNRVAHILHNVVKDCKGAANKNIGDAFLLSWKVPSGFCDIRSASGVLKGSKVSELFDNALYAFLRFHMLLRQHDKFIMRFSPLAKSRLVARMPNYRCAMGMGLHVGVAVEGAIGTHLKIDATYISQHVNHTEFLESSTKIYGVPLLMSDSFRNHLSPEVQACCRHLDTVRVNASLNFQLWTYDIDMDAQFLAPPDPKDKNANPPPPQPPLLGTKKKSTNSFKEGMIAFVSGKPRPTKIDPRRPNSKKVDCVLGDETDNKIPVIKSFPDGVTKLDNSMWTTDPDLLKLRGKLRHDGLMESWNTCSKLYHSGKWRECVEQLELFQEAFMISNNNCRDGPADYLLGVLERTIESNGYIDKPGHPMYHDPISSVNLTTFFSSSAAEGVVSFHLSLSTKQAARQGEFLIAFNEIRICLEHAVRNAKKHGDGAVVEVWVSFVPSSSSAKEAQLSGTDDGTCQGLTVFVVKNSVRPEAGLTKESLAETMRNVKKGKHKLSKASHGLIRIKLACQSAGASFDLELDDEDGHVVCTLTFPATLVSKTLAQIDVEKKTAVKL